MKKLPSHTFLFSKGVSKYGVEVARGAVFQDMSLEPVVKPAIFVKGCLPRLP